MIRGEQSMMEEVIIKTDFIKLQQLLKLAGVVGQGSDAKIYIKDNMVKVNGVITTERGKKIHHEDVIEVQGVGSFKVVVK